MAKIPKKIRKWRAKQGKGAIMDPETFEKIVRKCLADNPSFSRLRCETIAGSAYWKTVKAKYRKAKRRKNKRRR